MNKVKEVWKRVPEKDAIAIIFILMIIAIYLITKVETFRAKLSVWLLYTIVTNIIVRIRKNKRNKKKA